MERFGFRPHGYVEPQEARSIIVAVRAVSRHPDRDSLLLELLWQSGARVSEALTLVPERVGFTAVGLYNLKQKQQKQTGLPPIKEVEISESLCNRLKQYCITYRIKEGDYIFKPNTKSKLPHLSRNYVWWIVNRASEYAKVYKLGRRTTKNIIGYRGAWPHLFRHGNAMKLLEETGDITIVKEQLGHAYISTTQGYAYAKKPRVRKEIAKIEW